MGGEILLKLIHLGISQNDFISNAISMSDGIDYGLFAEQSIFNLWLKTEVQTPPFESDILGQFAQV